mmetsp:Transcript_81019/g.169170  ORF Transcript_81019/g.169170 Transcript_81019/m.169170 type:complete len:198 (+) Transcript_81019:76-669(+)|eukprot:CAMPEP_0206561676 /NCGR_PEP_ID=MMETSP0325_2-20121206/21760_1 /ASSEMBLY_ACC=CAM_ASM_000347 /TAXON_ID=2866 /ORGANISM="Crypthecodinium cohnii, Strain Seligo" /LENGTH=197 /DNA_ID=CAMNT_0054063671 /DNA_START=74 /DNA_END=667 /DNA_ORIENTATION=-
MADEAKPQEEPASFAANEDGDQKPETDAEAEKATTATAEAAATAAAAAAAAAPVQGMPAPAVEPVRSQPPAPKRVAGWLGKKSPHPLKFGYYQRRFFVLDRAELSWWRDEESSKNMYERLGSLDLNTNHCLASFVPTSTIKFLIEPVNGRWVAGGNFTGHNKGRLFYLESRASPVSREMWVEAIENHVEWARANLTL